MSVRVVHRTKVLAAVATAGLLGIGLITATVASAAPAVSPVPTGALVVGSCQAGGLPTITAAVAAAPAGGVIYVCPGVYEEDVQVTKSLSILGPQHGVDGRTGRADDSVEAIVRSATGAFTIPGGVDVVTIDGFTMRGSGTDTVLGNGIDAFNRGSGLRVVNNVFADNTNGMNFNANGEDRTTIQRNRFVANNRSGGQGGQGIFNTSGAANNVLISDNLFEGNRVAAFNTIGDAAPNRSTGLVFRNNRSIDDASLAVVNQASGARIEFNEHTRTPGLTGSGIFLGGNSDGTQVRGNRITGGAGVGIALTADFGSPSTDVLIEANLIEERATGIRVAGAHDDSVTIRLNGVLGSNGTAAGTGFGIRLQSDTDGVVLAKNAVLGSRVFDCRDESTGLGSAGTANMWLLNVGNTSSPAGLCLPGIISPEVPGDPEDPKDPKDDDPKHDDPKHGHDDKSKDDDGYEHP